MATQSERDGAEWELVKSVRFHDLRHDWAHRARQSGWTLEEIAVYAGHQTKDGAPAIATTARYTLPSRAQLKARLAVIEPHASGYVVPAFALAPIVWGGGCLDSAGAMLPRP